MTLTRAQNRALSVLPRDWVEPREIACKRKTLDRLCYLKLCGRTITIDGRVVYRRAN